MLNFDSNHSYIEGNIKEKKGTNNVKKMIATGLIIANLVGFSGCARTVSCDIPGDHAHYYVSQEDSLGRYIKSEKEKVSGLERTDDYVVVSEEEKELLQYLNKKDLYRIEDNKEVIENIIANHEDYVEQEVMYYYLEPYYESYYDGENVVQNVYYTPKIEYAWERVTNGKATGRTRDCHYMYQAYKVEKDENNNYHMIESELVDELSQLPEGYDYVKEKFYTIVNAYDKKEVFTHDNNREGNQIITEEEYNIRKAKEK